MPPSKLQKAIGAVKDRTSISLAKVGNSTSLAELEIAIVKATRHEEYPAEERHIREIISLTSYSRGFIGASVSFIARRLNKTKNWIVALKTLILVHRLITDGDPAFEQEIFFATRRGTRILNMSDFRDASHSDSWDYSAFVRTLALYLDERLEYRMQGQRGKRSGYGREDDDGGAAEGDGGERCKSTPVLNMRNDQIFCRMHHLQQLLQRFLACRPTGSARSNRIVIVALYQVVKESFQIYHETTELMGIMIDRFMEMHIPKCAKVHDMFRRSAKQFDDLDLFYNWCKKYGIARSSEYPYVERLSPKKLDLMDEFIKERSTMARSRRVYSLSRDQSEDEDEDVESKEGGKEDASAVKALPEIGDVREECAQEAQVPENEKSEMTEMGDLLNLWDEPEARPLSSMEIVLFNCGASETGTGTSVTVDWEAFRENTDWETALVEAASSLTGQKASLGGGFDALLLDGMYQRGEIVKNSANASGSASSVAFIGRPTMLALPAPPGAGDGITGGDPFAASLVVPPPAYVQMSDLDKKQNLLLEEQVLWQQYARDGMQGQTALDKLQTNPAHVVVPYNFGQYPQNYGSFG